MSGARPAWLMAMAGLQGWPRAKRCGQPVLMPPRVRNMLQRDFSALELKGKWLIGITELKSQQTSCICASCWICLTGALWAGRYIISRTGVPRFHGHYARRPTQAMRVFMSTIYRMLNTRNFHQQRRLSRRCGGWPDQEVQEPECHRCIPGHAHQPGPTATRRPDRTAKSNAGHPKAA